MIFLLLACRTSDPKTVADTAIEPEEEVEAACSANDTMINSTSGCIEGFSYQEKAMFLGIPYAEPPVGDLRWKRPVPVQPWSDVRIFEELSPACTQDDGVGGIMGGEDCLTLNVFRPAELEEELPILFFTHGGSFVSGMGSSDIFEASPALGTKAIFVTHNYRLGPFGFLAHEAFTAEDAVENGGVGTSGNLGILDTLMALQWVFDNAEALGGSQENIMVFGESAGGISTCALLVMPESEGLFSSALIQSAACTAISIPIDIAEEQGNSYEEALDCAEAEDPMSCMREATAEQVMAVDLGSGLGPGAGFSPNVDGVFIPQATGSMLYSGDFHDVPIAAGVTANEGSMFIHYLGLETETELDETLREYGSAYGFSDLDTLVSLYSVEEFGGAQAAMDQFYGDLFFVCPTRLSLDMISFYTPTYAYYYSHVPSWIPAYPELDGWGSYHSSELPFVFGTYLSYLTAEEQEFSDQMMNTWVNFAKGEYGADGGGWDLYGQGTSAQIDGGKWLSLQPNDFQMVSGVRKQRCDFMIDQWFGQ